MVNSYENLFKVVIKTDIMDKLIVLDFGGQYAHLIANRIRRLGVYAEIMEPDEKIDSKDLKGIILSGGPSSVYDKNAPKYDRGFFSLGVPVLGICYGLQLLAHELGGKVSPGKTKEYGIAHIDIKDSLIFKGLSKREQVWMSHGDAVHGLPSGFDVIAATTDCPVAAIADETRKIYGVQFHPEVTHTPNGMRILENFIDMCKCKKNWNMHEYLRSIEKDILKQAAGQKVFMLVSGGVDSTVAFALLLKTLGDKVHGVHIDSGFMRKDETSLVADELSKLGWRLDVIDAKDEFYSALAGVCDPEEKRKIIGKVFIDVANRYIQKLGVGEDWIIGQGTIYPDTIETGRTNNAEVIKTHHNRAGVVHELISQGKVIEPLQFLYKDEVRELGKELGLPEKLVMRHPFPGPGLAIRILCANKSQMPDDAVEIEREIEEMFPVYKAKVLPIKSVGVQGDSRSYRNPVLLSGPLDWDTLGRMSTAITNRFRQLNRVVYALTDARDIVLDFAGLSEDRIKLAREADAVTMEALLQHRLMQDIWQCPTVLLPIIIDGKKCAVLRPINSTEAMTANFAVIPKEAIDDIITGMRKIGIGALFYDITNKPPGTIEWE